jgi:hypothetical protein
MDVPFARRQSAGVDEVESSFESPCGEWKLSGIPAYREFTGGAKIALRADCRSARRLDRAVIFGRGQTAGTILVEKWKAGEPERRDRYTAMRQGYISADNLPANHEFF